MEQAELQDYSLVLVYEHQCCFAWYAHVYLPEILYSLRHLDTMTYIVNNYGIVYPETFTFFDPRDMI